MEPYFLKNLFENKNWNVDQFKVKEYTFFLHVKYLSRIVSHQFSSQKRKSEYSIVPNSSEVFQNLAFFIQVVLYT